MFTHAVPLNVKVQVWHKNALRALAKLEGETMSVILRRLIKEAALEKGVWLDDQKPDSEKPESLTKG